MNSHDLVFVIPTYRLRDVGEAVERYDQHFWKNGHSVRIMVFDDSSPANQIVALHTRALAAVSRAESPVRAEALRLFASNLHKAFYGFEPDFFQQNLVRIVDDVVSVIRGSIELWPTLVEITYFQNRRHGLPQVRVRNKKA